MPTRELSRDELSMLLFVYLGMGSDIMELLVLFEEDYVLQDDIAIYSTLSIWTLSLMQFTLVLTTTSKPKEEADVEREAKSACACCASEIWSICLSMILQDGPFLALRLYVIVKNQTLSYTILFFTLKNILMLMIQTYRLFVVGLCRATRTTNTQKSRGSSKKFSQRKKTNGFQTQQREPREMQVGTDTKTSEEDEMKPY